jgi:hypothetical protein
LRVLEAEGAILKGSVVAINEDMQAAGALSKPYRLWHADGRSEFVAVVAEADTLEELRRVRRRPDWRYQITHNGMPVDEHGFPILQLPDQDLTLRE